MSSDDEHLLATTKAYFTGEAYNPNLKIKKKSLPSVQEFKDGILQKNRTILARAITLIESVLPDHVELAQNVLSELLPFSGKSIRIGITGSPGVGKSTFIEAFGTELCELGHRVAVLAVDPSSSISGGSILGDKTRMISLSNHENSFIRPSPAGDALGGVARKSRESMLLCEAAGYDVILVETVGVGQSETLVHSMVDCFVVLSLAGAGDELQGIKKGIIELADVLVITKSDGDNILHAEHAKAELSQVVRMLNSTTIGWRPPVLLTSSLEKRGIMNLWEVVNQYINKGHSDGFFTKKRQSQNLDWLKALIKEALQRSFLENKSVENLWPELSLKVKNGELSQALALKKLMDAYNSSLNQMVILNR